MKYEGVDFNIDIVTRHKDAAEFAADPANEHLWPNVGPNDRRKRFFDAYRLAKAIKTRDVDHEDS